MLGRPFYFSISRFGAPGLNFGYFDTNSVVAFRKVAKKENSKFRMLHDEVNPLRSVSDKHSLALKSRLMASLQYDEPWEEKSCRMTGVVA